MNYVDLANFAAKAAASKKAIRMVLMDLRGMSDLCDYQLICSGENARQTLAIAESIERSVRTEFRVKPSAIEGKTNGNWILMDYGPVNIHIFYDYLRDFYALEQLWPKAKFIDLKSV
ncbi:MAG: ribosome silencing factor [Bdellovibrionota bacterium]